MKHTPGPWNTQIAQPYEDFKIEVTYDTKDGLTYPIADVYSEEDAQPIAAVPELLKALKMVDGKLEDLLNSEDANLNSLSGDFLTVLQQDVEQAIAAATTT